MTGEWEKWSSVVAAKIPVAELAALASLRTRNDVTVQEHDGSYWVHWKALSVEVIRTLLPIPGVSFLSKRTDGQWSRFGSRLPTSLVPPEDRGSTLIHRLSPKLDGPRFPRLDPVEPIRLSLVRSPLSRPVTALICPMESLRRWADSATTHEITRLKAAYSEGNAILLGTNLPALANSQRMTGHRLLVPIGFRVEPDLGETVIRHAIGAEESEWALFSDSGVDLVPDRAIQPLTRAGIRRVGGPQ